MIKPRTYDLLVRNVRATEFGLYPIDWAVPRTRCATALLTRLRSLLFMTNDTVQLETPASFAMSLIDTNGFALSAWRLCEADSIVCPPFFGDTLPFSFSRIGCPAAMSRPGHCAQARIASSASPICSRVHSGRATIMVSVVRTIHSGRSS